ncbi:hypothetical protein METHP15_530013 [Pseudomonas sp. P15-2025]
MARDCVVQQGGRARVAQEGLARNKCRSGFSREAPRGRRSISPTPHRLRRAVRRWVIRW